MDESRRDRINQRIQEARRLASFSIPVDLANETEWLLADLAEKESTITQLLAEAERDAEVRNSIRVERERLKESVASQAKRIAELEPLLAHASSVLPTEDDIRKAWYSGDSAGIGAGVGVARMLQDRFVPLLAAKDTEVDRLRSALETKTREWMAATTAGDNLKEQLRRLMSDLGAAESRAIKVQLPSVEEMHTQFEAGHEEAYAEASGVTSYAADANGLRRVRDMIAGLFGVKDSMVVASDAPKTTTEPALGLRQRFIAATKSANCSVANRTAYFSDLLRLCDVIDSAPCSSAEAVSRACAAFVGTVFSVDPSTKTLAQQNWSFIGRELKKHLGYEPTVYSDRIELRDGRVWYDYEFQKLTFTIH